MIPNGRSDIFQTITNQHISSIGEQANMKNYNVTAIKDILKTAKKAVVVVPQISIDSIGAALALAIALKKKSIETSVFATQKTDNNYSKLSGLDLITDTLSSGDLVVSLADYPLDKIENVSYNDDGGKLNLVIKVKSDAPKIQDGQIVIQNQSQSADIYFILGDESALGANSTMVNRGNWVFVSPVEVSKTWAKASIIDPDAPYSEMFTFLLPMLGLEIDMDSGKDLLIGLRVATQSFAVNVSPESFEAGAICLRATQPPEGDISPPPAINQAPIESIERGASVPGTNKPNPTPVA